MLECQYSPNHSIQLELSEDSETESEANAYDDDRPLHVIIHGPPAEILETIEQFAWLATALRSPGEDSTGPSQFDLQIERVSPTGLVVTAALMLHPIQSYVDTAPRYGSRWLALMKSSALAWGFPIKERENAVGLEIPYQLMLKEVFVRTPSEYDDSIIICQKPLTIYPTAKYDEGIQWRAVVGGMLGFFDEIKTVPLLSLGNDSESFYKRTFIPTKNLVFSLSQLRNFVG